MILAIETDNSRINIGIFENGELVKSFGVATDTKKTSDEYAVTFGGILSYYGIERTDIDGAALSSVVPQLTNTVAEAVKRIAGDIDVLTIGKGTKTGFPIKIDNPAEMGTDLVANAAAVIDIIENENKSGAPCVIIDMGTATTVFALNHKKEYIGGSIIPGIGMSFDALHRKTALIPNISPIMPSRVIGRSSQESVRSGVLLGNAMMLDGFIDRFYDEMNGYGKMEVFITGEYAEVVLPLCSHNMRYVPELTLNGLYCIYKNNIKA